MKKASIILLILVVIGGAVGYYVFNNYPMALPNFIEQTSSDYKYVIKRSGKIVAVANKQEEAIAKAKSISRSIAINTYNNEWVYLNLQPFLILTEDATHDFATFEEAYKYARRNGYKKIYYKSGKRPFWQEDANLTEGKMLDVPLVLQLPELPRGCEVTSLTMLLKYYDINVSKMTLAEKVKKDPTPYSKDKNGRKYYGNPYDGFVGDMYNKDKNGYGVYHEPIAELGKEYVGEDLIDITGVEFEDLLYFLSQGKPVWVITNATYKSLGDNQFEMWHTPTGIVKITKKLHSVVVTGFDEQYIYINDPLSNIKNKKTNRSDFQKAWEQMGNQAIIIAK